LTGQNDCPAADTTVFLLAEGCVFQYRDVNSLHETPVIYRLKDLFPGWPHDDLTAAFQTGNGKIVLVKGGDAMDFGAPGEQSYRGEYKLFTEFHCDTKYHQANDPNPHGIISLPQSQYIMSNEPGDKRCVSSGADLYSILAYSNLRTCLGSDTPVGAILSLSYKKPVRSYAVFAKDQSKYRICEEINGHIRGTIYYTANRDIHRYSAF